MPKASSRLQIERHELRVFDGIMRAGGFSRAADALNLSQSAVSQAIANLEHKLGTILIKRGRQPELTEAGVRLQSYATIVLHEEALALDDIERIRTGALSTLNLATNSMVNRYFARALMLQFCEDNPLTKLKLDVIPSKEIIYGVVDGRWELGFGPFQNEMPRQLTTRVLLTETRTLCVHKQHPYFDALLENASAQLHNVTLLTSYLDEVDKRPDTNRLRTQFGAVWEISNLDLRLDLAAAGKGVTYLSNRLLDDHTDMVAIPGLDSGVIPRDVGIYYRKDDPLSAGASRFLALCDRHFDTLRA